MSGGEIDWGHHAGSAKVALAQTTVFAKAVQRTLKDLTNKGRGNIAAHFKHLLIVLRCSFTQNFQCLPFPEIYTNQVLTAALIAFVWF